MKHISKLVLVFSLLFSSALFVSTVNATEADESDADVASTCVNIPIKLQYQSRDTGTSNYVLLLQDFLNDKGYLPTQPTGFFGAGTLRAVKAFQRANGISQTGALGPLTRAKIQNISCEGVDVAVSVTPTCNSAQSLVNGVCVTMTRTCPDGRVLAVSRSCDTSVSAPSAPNFTIAGMSSTRVKVVSPEESMTMSWNVPSASSYKIKVDMPNGDLQDKEYPTTLTTWTGSVKDLLGMTSGIVGLYIKACDASGICGEYSLPVSIVVKSSVTTNTQSTVANQVPVVTIKAVGYKSGLPAPRNLALLTWTATNNPTYCTATEGDKTSWLGRKALPLSNSGTYSYNQVIDTSDVGYASTITFKISCTNANGSSQIASVNFTTPADITAANLATADIRRSEGIQVTDGNGSRIVFSWFTSDGSADIYSVKVCKNLLTSKVFLAALDGPCKQSSDFVNAVDQSGVIRDFGGWYTHSFSQNDQSTQLGVPLASDALNYLLLKSSNGKYILDLHNAF